MNEIRICKYCGMELSEDVPHGLRECHLHAVNRIAELEEQVWNLNLENERMEEAYWIDESIAPDGTSKPSVRKLLERLEKAETDLRLSDGLVKALDNRIAELEEAQRWRVVADGELPEVYRDEDGDFIPFLVCEGDGGYPFVAMYDGINWRAGIFVPDITHWMPLPEPPIVYGKVCEE